MGLKTTIQNAASSAKKATLDLWVSIDYQFYNIPAYDVLTGVVTNTKKTTTLRVLVNSYNSKQVNGNAVKKTDLMVIINQSELIDNETGLALAPDTNDIVTYSGKDWNIIDIQQDPANVLWELQLRVSN